MKCAVCGQDYGVTHNCAGVAPLQVQAPPAPSGFALGHYLLEGWHIVSWNDEAVRRVKDDPRATSYGVWIWAVTQTVSFLIILYTRTRHPELLSAGRVAFVIVFALLYGGTLGIMQLGIVHFVARRFCGGKGQFVQVLRPLLLASFVYILLAIPVAGFLIAGLASTFVMVMVFNEVDGMPQLTAFLVSAAAGFVLRLLTGDVFRVPY